MCSRFWAVAVVGGGGGVQRQGSEGVQGKAVAAVLRSLLGGATPSFIRLERWVRRLSSTSFA
eukprot:6212294-Pleurochrysis_carterae.AAC.3